MLFNKPVIAAIIFIMFLMFSISNAEKTILVNDYEHFLVISLLKSDNREVRKRAAITLGKNRVTGAADELIKLAKDESREVRKEAATALGKIGRVNAMKPQMYRFDDNGKRYEYNGGLRFVEKKPIIKTLSEMLKDPDDEVRAAVMEALAETFDGPAMELIIAGLKDKSVIVRKSALKGLAVSGGTSEVELVTELLKDPDLKETAESTLVRIKNNIDRRKRIEWDLKHGK